MERERKEERKEETRMERRQRWRVGEDFFKLLFTMFPLNVND